MDEEVQKLLDVERYDLAVIKPRELPNGVTYIGTIQGEGMDIYSYNEWFLDNWTNKDKPENKPLVPTNAVPCYRPKPTTLCIMVGLELWTKPERRLR